MAIIANQQEANKPTAAGKGTATGVSVKVKARSWPSNNSVTGSERRRFSQD
ncbi:MAG: hypothetical protein WC782_06015 [Methylococcaceae bacterium]